MPQTSSATVSPSAPPRLPETGTDPLTAVWAGLGLVTAGVGVVLLARRRRA